MAEAISNTSPLLYLYRIGAIDWLAEIFQSVWVPNAVVLELREGQRKGHDVPVPSNYGWLKVVDPNGDGARSRRRASPCGERLGSCSTRRLDG